MSWILFIQLFVLIGLVCCTGMAMVNKMAERHAPFKRKPIVYYSIPKPDPVDPQAGDLWMNPQSMQTFMYNPKAGDWVEVEAS